MAQRDRAIWNRFHCDLRYGHLRGGSVSWPSVENLSFTPFDYHWLRGWRGIGRTPQSAHRPHKSTDEHRQCNPGDGIHFVVLLGSDNSYTTPFEIFLLIWSRQRTNREVQTVNWEGGGHLKGLSRGVSRAAWKRCINRELEAKKAHKPWIREGLNREVQTVN